MRNLADTIARLTAQRGLKLASQDAGAGRLSDLADFGSNPGALRARTYVPEGLPAGAPLVVVLHGCTQTAAGYDSGSGWSRLADEQGFALLFPEQQRVNNPNLCFNWFVPADTRRDEGEALSIRQMIETLVDSHDLDRMRIFVTGLSAGGGMASSMLASYPEMFRGGAIIAGLPHGTATTIPQAFDRMRGHGLPTAAQAQASLRAASDHDGSWPSISVWHGTADQTVAFANAEAIVAQWRGVHGVAAKPSRVEQVDGQKRQVWCDKQGVERLELYSIAGMGHGTPIHPSAQDGLGAAAPFMLDAGISSTRRIAQSWGIASEPKATKARVEPATRLMTRPADKPAARPMKETAQPAAAGGVQQTIEKALRAAGLMR